MTKIIFFQSAATFFAFIVFFTPAAAICEDNDTLSQAQFIDKLEHNDFYKSGDEDWWKFYGISGVSYTITAQNLGIRCSIVIELYDPYGVKILKTASSTGYGVNTSLEWTCPLDELYYIKTRHIDPNIFGDNTGYDITVNNSFGYDAYENDNNFESARLIIINDPILRHNFHIDGDEDWIKFHVIEGITNTFTIKVTNVEANSDPIIELFDTDGKTLLKSKDIGSKGQNETLDYTPAKTGIYYVRIRNAVHLYGDKTSYDLNVIYSQGLPPCCAKGLVTDSCTKARIDNVKIILKLPNGQIHENFPLSLTSGAYTIRDSYGNYELIAKKDGYQPYSAPLTLPIPNTADSCGGYNIEMISETKYYRDADGDGYGNPNEPCSCPSAGCVPDNTDCNDNDSNINPQTIWYKDIDNDGYSDGTTQVSCLRPSGYKLASELKAISDDCDDNDPNINPATIWYKDMDNDGYFDGTTQVQCLRPLGYKLASELFSTTGDCNDYDPSIHPNAIEICNKIDDNCDGSIDEGLNAARIDLSLLIRILRVIISINSSEIDNICALDLNKDDQVGLADAIYVLQFVSGVRGK